MRFLSFRNEKYMDQLKKIPHKFNVVTDEENNTTAITIYGVIGSSWWEDSTSAADVDNALNNAGTNDIVINLNSPGGDAFDGIAIYNRLKRHEGNVKIFVDGWACSAASIIALAADELIMGNGSMFMIHEAATGIWGKKGDLLKEAELLGKLDSSLVDVYMSKSRVSRDDIEAKLQEETWFTAPEALEIGFADKVEQIEEPKEPIENRLTNEQVEQIIAAVTNRINNNFPKEPEQEPAAKRNLSKLFLNLN